MLEFVKDFRNFLLIKNSQFFDTNYYLSNYPDVRQSGINPLWHFVRFGWKEGRNPSESFNTNFYLDRYQNGLALNLNPLVHYLKYGKTHGYFLHEKDLYERLISQQKQDRQPLAYPDLDKISDVTPELSNWNRSAARIIQRNDKLWVLARLINFSFLQRELLATQLGAGLVNLVEVQPLLPQDYLELASLKLLPPSADPYNLILRRLAQDYSVDELPNRTLDSSAAGEFVFSLWIRRNDPNEYNRVYVAEGIPVFFDLNASFGFEGDTQNIDTFFANTKPGHAGRWRIRQIGDYSANSLGLRALSFNYQYFTIGTIDGFSEEIFRIAEEIHTRQFDFVSLIKNAGYVDNEIDNLNKFLRNNQQSLMDDVKKGLDYVLSYPIPTLSKDQLPMTHKKIGAPNSHSDQMNEP
jgi:hypothetical protein